MSMPPIFPAVSSPINISAAVGSGSQALPEPALSLAQSLPHAQGAGRILSSDAVRFGCNDTNSSGQQPAAAPPSTTTRLMAAMINAVNKTFVWNAPAGRCIKSDLKWGMGLALATLPFALIIPGSQLLLIPAVMGWRMAKRFYQEAKVGYHNPDIINANKA